MKAEYFFKDDIDESEREDFERTLIADNLHRGKILAAIVIIFEAVYIIIDITASIMKVDDRFAFDAYLIMYLIMILINTAYLLTVHVFYSGSETPDNRIKGLRYMLIIYITMIMSWGSILSLMDQKLYGQVMPFMVNMIVCSVIYIINSRHMLIPYAVSVIILLVCLPFYQSSGDMLVGHYANLSVFICVSWIASRIIYRNYCKNYSSRVLLNRSNSMLNKKIEENIKITAKLEAANNQLKELALIDELTGIPNRRSFRDFIDRAFQLYVREDSSISIIMIDVDHFKEFNDCYGHEAGDRALIAIAGEINSAVAGPYDFAVRWGGEEFVYAAFNRNAEEIRDTAEIIRKRVAELGFADLSAGDEAHITISLGISSISITDKKGVNKAVKLADKALYTAKSGGRNCIRMQDAI